MDDIEEQIVMFRAALPIWRTEDKDLVELVRKSKRTVSAMDKRTLHRMRGSLGATAGGHDTLLYLKKAGCGGRSRRRHPCAQRIARCDAHRCGGGRVDVAASNVMSPHEP